MARQRAVEDEVQRRHALQRRPSSPYLPASRFRSETAGFTAFQWFAYYVPAAGWLRTYPWRSYLLVRVVLGRVRRCARSLRRPPNAPRHLLCAAQNDVLAGLSVGVMVIPQGMSYAQVRQAHALARGPWLAARTSHHPVDHSPPLDHVPLLRAQNLAYLPQVYGLYGSFLPCIAYSLLGSSRQLVVGPVAVTSLLLGNGLRCGGVCGGGPALSPLASAAPRPRLITLTTLQQHLWQL